MEPALPRIAVQVARAKLGVVALLLLIALLGGVAMQLELWSPGARWDQAFYGEMIGVHALAILALGAPVLAGCFGYAMVTRTVGAQRVAAPVIAWIALGVWLVGVAAAAYLVGREAAPGWTMYTPYAVTHSRVPELVTLFAFALSATLYALHLGAVVVRSRRAPPAKLAIAAAFVAAIAVAGGLGLVDAIAFAREVSGDLVIVGLPTTSSLVSPDVASATRAAALVLATAALVDDRRAVLGLVAIACAAAWGFVPDPRFGFVVVGLWIALAITNGFGRTSVAFVVFGCGVALAVLGVASRSGHDTDLHLHDTHFSVAETHLFAMIGVWAALAALHAWGRALLGRTPHALYVWIGASTASLGMVVQAHGSMRGGLAGMPRRYWDYDPVFTNGHQISAAGAGILLLGLAVIAVGWFTAARPLRR